MWSPVPPAIYCLSNKNVRNLMQEVVERCSMQYMSLTLGFQVIVSKPIFRGDSLSNSNFLSLSVTHSFTHFANCIIIQTISPSQHLPAPFSEKGEVVTEKVPFFQFFNVNSLERRVLKLGFCCL